MAHAIRAPVVTFENAALFGGVITLEHEPEYEHSDTTCADGTNHRLWPASLVLSEWLCAHPEAVAGKRVVELGSGSGAVGLVCAALGASSVTLTDVPDALPMIMRNVQRNVPPPGTTVRVLPCLWGDAAHIDALLESPAGQLSGYDIVLCCECVYQQSEEVLRALAHTQRALSCSQYGPPGASAPSKVLLAYEYRSGLQEDLVYFDAATDFFGDSETHELGGGLAQTFMAGTDDGDDDRFLYIYDVPPPGGT